MADLSGIAGLAVHDWTSGGLGLLRLFVAGAGLGGSTFAVGPLDGDLAGLGGVDVQGDLAETRRCACDTALERVLEEVV